MLSFNSLYLCHKCKWKVLLLLVLLSLSDLVCPSDNNLVFVFEQNFLVVVTLLVDDWMMLRLFMYFNINISLLVGEWSYVWPLSDLWWTVDSCQISNSTVWPTVVVLAWQLTPLHIGRTTEDRTYYSLAVSFTLHQIEIFVLLNLRYKVERL